MKTKEELNIIKEEIETLNKKLVELTEEELAQVTGGSWFKLPLNMKYGPSVNGSQECDEFLSRIIESGGGQQQRKS